eukprot:GFYU01003525.1.p2 GENE.GFYU01003525.1~~GFYU01003525.1.p2  ORF type:complete len:364 (-),score=116.26 GFYU01003525.1:154-1194(-)
MAKKIAIMGSGNWGSAIAKIVGNNAARLDSLDNTVKMWVFEEEVNGRKLTEIINTDHENVKYLPGVKLPENVIAVPDPVETAKEADILIFVLPHQFLPRLCGGLKGNLKDGVRAVSLIKGIDFDADHNMILMSTVISDALGVPCSVLMGANVANEVAQEQFCESTVGAANAEDGAVLKSVFHCHYFQIRVVEDVAGVELCGALKNVIALGAGFCDGMDLGGNTKAAIIRIGLGEMQRFSQRFYKTIKDQTYLESCGVADLITTCYGGRNRKCAEAFVREKKDWDTVEKELLGGQKLQGTGTAEEVYKILKAKDMEAEFPLITNICRISFDGQDPASLVIMEQAEAI